MSSILSNKAALDNASEAQIVVPAADYSPLSHWGVGTKDSTVHPRFVQDHFASGQSLPAMDEVYDPDAFRVPASSIPEDPLLGDGINVLGCPLRGRNVCCNDPQQPTIRRIAQALSTLTRAAGKALAKSGDLLVLAESVGPLLGGAEGKARRLALLTAPVYKPMFQDLTLCTFADGITHTAADLVFPFDVEVSTSPCRLQLPGDEQSEVFRHSTSDEFAKALSAEAMSWSLQALDYEVVSAFKMRVGGYYSAVAGLKATTAQQRSSTTPRPQTPSTDLAAALLALDGLQQDPMVHNSGREARRRGRGAGAQGRTPLSGPSANANASGSAGEDTDVHPMQEFDEMESDGVASDEDALALVLGVDAGLCELASGLHKDVGDLQAAVGDGAGVVDDNVGGGADTASVIAPPGTALEEGLALASAATEEALASAGWGDAAAAAPEAPTQRDDPAADFVVGAVGPSPPDALAVEGGPLGWTKTPSGYVFTPACRKAGRLTKWGASNASMKCDFHKGCSLAKSSRSASDGKFMRWLAVGGGPALAPPAFQELAAGITDKATHMAAWFRLDQVLAAGTASSSSSAAALALGGAASGAT